ncbi:winged helix DNA-binding domain-containing protein [Streptomyces sp. NPDC059002]|uniref:winged helix DNA-binding domain-containing protein n=1 Tax=Streptomyces sp. NPDC059002 TaxID=3346690 RepID=UPI0036D067DA
MHRTTRRHISGCERRARLAYRQRLEPAQRAEHVDQVARSVLALHATDPATVYLSAAARLAEPRHETVERELYEREALLRMTAMRCTLFVTPTGLAPVLLAAAGKPHAANRRKHLLRQLEASGAGDDRWLEKAGRAVLEVLAERGGASTAELAAAVAGLERQIVVAPGKRYESRRSVAADLMFVLAAEGRVVRGTRRGGWTSSQHAWALGLALPELAAASARAELARLWLGAFGPGTVADLKWWTGWTVTDTRKALAAAGAVEVGLDEGTGYALTEDLEDLEGMGARVAEPAPAAALLPALDPTPMGWRERGFYLDPAHVPALFDRMGNIGPTVWWEGRIVGGWAQRKDGTLNWRLLEDPGREARTAVEAEAARMAAFLGERRFTPAYRTPLERELAS